MPNLQDEYDWCRELCRASRSSFFASFRLLTRERRQAMYALYAFARISDDLSDQPINDLAEKTSGAESTDYRSRQLATWRKLIVERLPTSFDSEAADYLKIARETFDYALPQRTSQSKPGLPGEDSTTHGHQPPLQRDSTSNAISVSLDHFEALWPALQDAMLRYHIPRQLMIDIVDGVSMDLDIQRIADWPTLYDYCYHVASAVGLACVYIWTDGSHIPVQPAIRCGVAFQLTNILRDVAEDARCNRIYVPNSVLAEHGVTISSWLGGNPDGEWQTVIAEIGTAAEELYRQGWPTIESLSPDSQRMFSLIWRSYRGLLEEVLTRKPELWNRTKISLPASRRWGLAASHFLPLIYNRLSVPTSG